MAWAPRISPYLVPWEELPDDLKEANRRFAGVVERALTTAGLTAVADPLVDPASVDFALRARGDQKSRPRGTRGVGGEPPKGRVEVRGHERPGRKGASAAGRGGTSSPSATARWIASP